MKLARWLMSSCLVALASLGSCMGVGVTIDAGYTQMSLSGDMSLAPTIGGNQVSAEIDVEQDLGLDDTMGSPYGRADLALGLVGVSVSGFSLDQSGVGTLSARFGDIPANTSVATDVELSNLKALAVLDLLHLGPVRLSPGLGVDLFDLDLQMRSTTIAVSERVDELLPIPMLFAQAAVDVGPFAAVADLGGMYYDASDVEGSFLDFELLARFRPVDHFEVFAGYRLIFIDGEGDPDGQDFSADLRLQGFTVGGGISF